MHLLTNPQKLYCILKNKTNNSEISLFNDFQLVPETNKKRMFNFTKTYK